MSTRSDRVVKEIRADVSRNPSKLIGAVSYYNSVNGVDSLEEEGLNRRDIDDFFVGLVELCFDMEIVLPQRGYMNLVKFACNKGLLRQ